RQRASVARDVEQLDGRPAARDDSIAAVQADGTERVASALPCIEPDLAAVRGPCEIDEVARPAAPQHLPGALPIYGQDRPRTTQAGRALRQDEKRAGRRHAQRPDSVRRFVNGGAHRKLDNAPGT